MFKKLLISVFCLTTLSVYAQDVGEPSPPLGRTVDKFGSSRKHGETHYKNHNDYKHWTQPPEINPMETSCCNDNDCDIVAMFFDEVKNQYYIIYDSYRLYIQPEAFLKEKDGSLKKSPDGNAHACVIEYEPGIPHVVCAVNGNQMF